MTTPALAEADHGPVNQLLADKVITQAYIQYHQSMQALAPAIGGLCRTPSEVSLLAAKEAYNESADAWQHLQPMAFGPIEAKGLDARIHFWPDKHGTAGKQLSKLLAKPDPAALDNGVAGKSAALQSLSALERVLFDQSDELITKDGAFACSLALAIAEYQGDLSEGILDAWQVRHQALFTKASNGNDAYYDTADATTDLFGAIAASLDNIIANKLERPLGKSLEKAKPKRAEDWRSGRSLLNIIANLETIKALYTEPGGLHVFLSEKGQDGLDQTIRKGFDQTIAKAASIEPSLFDAVGDEAARQQVEQLLQDVKSLRALITGTLAGCGNSHSLRAVNPESSPRWV